MVEIGDIINPQPNFYYLVKGIDESKDIIYLIYLNGQRHEQVSYSLDSVIKKGWRNWIYRNEA